MLYEVITRYESNEYFRFPIEEECINDSKYVIVALNNLTVAPDEDEITSEYMYETKAIMAWAIPKLTSWSSACPTTCTKRP